MGLVMFVFLTALGVAWLLTPYLRRLALYIGATDPVVSRSVHREPKPYLGGIALYAAFAVAVIASGSLADTGTRGILIVGALVCLIGLIDDLNRPRGIPAGVKLLLQTAAVLWLVLGFGVRVDWIRNPLLNPGEAPYLVLGYLAVPLTVIWIVSFINIVNLVDGLDGLAAGIAGIGSLTLLVVAAGQGQMQTVLLTAALAGAAVGFLRYNFNPAKIFMGDAGAMFLGFALGAISVHGVLKSAATVAVAVPVLAFGLPILDTLLAILRRVRSGKSVGEADREHLHHRLLQLGLPHRTVVLVLWTISGWLGLTAVAISELPLGQALGIMAFILAAAVLGVRKLGMLRVQPVRRQLDR